MKHEDVLTALEEISDKHILEAGKTTRKKNGIILKMAVAATVVLVIGINMLSAAMKTEVYAVTEASEPRTMASLYWEDYKESEVWKSTFWTDGNSQFLMTENNENKLWSPVNAYIGLAMMTELTEGETRQQILDLFGVEDTNTLRRYVSAMWESVYQNDSNEICALANSLWLEKGLQYDQKAMDALAYHYYASVYQGDLGSFQTNKDITQWIEHNTASFLKDDMKDIKLSQDCVMALYSTLSFQSKWSEKFWESMNTSGPFYMRDQTIDTVYMNKKLAEMRYYWGEDFSAVSMNLKNGSRMWFILPDEGKTTNDVLSSGHYMEMLLSDKWKEYRDMKVNLSVPKFDVSSGMDLSDGIKNMGVTRLFTENLAGFTNLDADFPLFITGMNQSVRVKIDEEGVKAAAYVEMRAETSGPPSEKVIDFVLNRPFLFVITNENIPLFAGCINHPKS